jgi:hypothetical protein
MAVWIKTDDREPMGPKRRWLYGEVIWRANFLKKRLGLGVNDYFLQFD